MEERITKTELLKEIIALDPNDRSETLKSLRSKIHEEVLAELRKSNNCEFNYENDDMFADACICWSIIDKKYGKGIPKEIIKDSILCPSCNGTIHYFISSSNGHCHGQCTTKDCVNWMQ